jgi:hypothetical protein
MTGRNGLVVAEPVAMAEPQDMDYYEQDPAFNNAYNDPSVYNSAAFQSTDSST